MKRYFLRSIVCCALAATLGQAQAATTERVSLSSTNEQNNGGTSDPSISADGNLIVYPSRSTNLVADDSNGAKDIFAWDRLTGITELISVATSGHQANDASNIYNNLEPKAVSSNGRYVIFSSYATNLVLDCDVSVYGSAMYLRDRVTNKTTCVGPSQHSHSMSADANWFAYIEEQDSSVIILKNLQSLVSKEITVPPTDGAVNRNISSLQLNANGRYLAFSFGETIVNEGESSETVRIMLYDHQEDLTTELLESSSIPRIDISGDGKHVAFTSHDTTLFPNDTNGYRDVFVISVATKIVEQVNVGIAGTANNTSNYPRINFDGRYVVFDSHASNLVDNDINGRPDIFLYDRQLKKTELISTSTDNQQSNGSSYNPVISANGRYVAFQGYGSNLVDNDTNGEADVFVRDRFGGMIDQDSDGIEDEMDNCLDITNSDQLDFDNDGQGDACDIDDDNDTVEDNFDACPLEDATDQDADLNGCIDSAAAFADLLKELSSTELASNLLISLTTTIENAQAALADDNRSLATNMLNAFTNKVEAQRGKKIDKVTADMLINYINNL